MSVSYSEAPDPISVGVDINDRMAAGAAYVHATGLPFAGMPTPERDAYIVHASSALGALTTTAGIFGSELWQLDSSTSPNASHIPMHTDNPFMRRPERIVGFWCMRSSSEGGENLILPVARLQEWMDDDPERRDLAVEMAETPLEHRHSTLSTRGVAIDSRAGTARFDKKYVVDNEHRTAARFAGILAVPGLPVEPVKLGAGEALFFNNRTVLHARAPYSDAERLSVRVRIADQ